MRRLIVEVDDVPSSHCQAWTVSMAASHDSDWPFSCSKAVMASFCSVDEMTASRDDGPRDWHSRLATDHAADVEKSS